MTEQRTVITSSTSAARANSSSWKTTFLGADEEGKLGNASWGAIFAGVVVSIAFLIMFSFLGAAIGLGVTDPTSNTPFEGVGVGLGIWAFFTVVISLAAGGFVAGALSVRAGFLHGLATWAASLIALFAIGAMGVSSAIGAVGNVLGGVGNAAGSVASAAGDAVSSAASKVSKNVDVDLTAYSDDVEKILSDTGKAELQPGYLRDQLDQSREDITNAVSDLAVNPENYENILNDLKNKLNARVDTISDAADRDAIANSVAKNTELSQAEAEKATDNAVQAVEKAQTEAKQAINDASAAIDQAAEDAKQALNDARKSAQNISNSAAGASVWGFVAILAAGAVTSFAGLWGSRAVTSRTKRVSN